MRNAKQSKFKRTVTGIILGLMLLLFASVTLAEQTSIETAAAEALSTAHPGFTMAAQDQWGDTAAAVLAKDTQHILCVAEKQNGSWNITIDNPTALWQGEQIPYLLMDADNAIYWHYVDGKNFAEYSAEKKDGVWGTVALRRLDANTDGSGVEYQISYGQSNRGMVISKTNWVQDENENLLNKTTDIPIPAENLAPYASLAAFDVEKFPGRFMNGQDWTNPFIRRSAAEQLMPEDTYLGGTIYGDSLAFLMQKPDGAKVFVGVAYSEAEGWTMTESTPLPEGTEYGRDNFCSSLYLSQKMLVNLDLFADGTWGVNYLYATPEDGTGNEMILFGQNWIADSLLTPQTRYFGDHPWNDVTTIDWNTLPMHLQDALQKLDQTGWAMVNNPNPEDRFHLRTQPNDIVASLGDYCNGTAVQILEDGETWVKVSILGVEGYMLKASLAYGETMNTIASAGPCVMLQSQFADLYKRPQEAKPCAVVTENDFDLRVVGVIGHEWYHVWFVGSGLSGVYAAVRFLGRERLMYDNPQTCYCKKVNNDQTAIDTKLLFRLLVRVAGIILGAGRHKKRFVRYYL